MNHDETQSVDSSVQGKRPFTEPEVSDPVDVVAGNPAAGLAFAVTGSGIPAPPGTAP